jgi:hypothetical protein
MLETYRRIGSGLMAFASIVIQRRIEWSDTDASGHWHNTAHCDLLLNSGRQAPELLASGIVEDSL